MRLSPLLFPVLPGLALSLLADTLYAKECYAPDKFAQEGTFSRAVSTEGGKIVWLGGHVATNPAADFDTQVREVFASLDKTIKAVGGSGLTNLVTMTVFILDNKAGARFTEIRKELFKECFPASALITVSGLPRAGLLIVIQGIAVIGGT